MRSLYFPGMTACVALLVCAGAAVAGALAVARRMAAAGERGNVVTVLPDRADRYFEPRRWDRRTSW